MAKPRVFSEPDSEAGIYHIVSRVVDRRHIFGPEEKEVFLRMLFAAAALHQIEILTFCLMSNHFHLMARVPRRPAGFDLTLERVVELWSRTVGSASRRSQQRRFAMFRENGCEVFMETWRQRRLARMFSLTEFVKTLKQSFTQWYNRREGRTGTLWERRYGSTIVAPEATALRTVAAYIDLNPVRAGIVDDPAGYRWCGYAEAMAGKTEALDGLAAVTGSLPKRGRSSSVDSPEETENPTARRRRLRRSLVLYRQILGLAGRPRLAEDGTMLRRGMSAQTRERLASVHGIRTEMLRRRVRHLTAGVVLGSRDFIDEWFKRNRHWFAGQSREHRATGARSMGRAWGPLCSLRRLHE
jgi:REP element-mobilizing transposase RayT